MMVMHLQVGVAHLTSDLLHQYCFQEHKYLARLRSRSGGVGSGLVHFFISLAVLRTQWSLSFC